MVVLTSIVFNNDKLLYMFSYFYWTLFLMFSSFFVHFSIGLIIFLPFGAFTKYIRFLLQVQQMCFYYICTNIFSESVACLLMSLTLFFAEHFLILMKSILQFFLSCIMPLVLYLKKHYSTQGHLGFLLCFLLGVI